MIKHILILIIFLTSSLGYSQTNQLDKTGKRHGVWKKYHKFNGKIRYIGTFNHGKEVGTFKYFSPNNSKQPIITREFIPNSDIALVKFYNENGTLESEGKMKGKNKIGTWIYYHKDGKTIMIEENYVNGKLEGAYKTHYTDKSPTVVATYHNGKLDGKYIKYSIKGKIFEDLTYKNGKLNGLAIYYDRLTGIILEKGNYKDNIRIGNWEFFIDGELANTIDMNKRNELLDRKK